MQGVTLRWTCIPSGGEWGNPTMDLRSIRGGEWGNPAMDLNPIRGRVRKPCDGPASQRRESGVTLRWTFIPSGREWGTLRWTCIPSGGEFGCVSHLIYVISHSLIYIYYNITLSLFILTCAFLHEAKLFICIAVVPTAFSLQTGCFINSKPSTFKSFVHITFTRYKRRKIIETEIMHQIGKTKDTLAPSNFARVLISILNHRKLIHRKENNVKVPFPSYLVVMLSTLL